jgi:C-terminal processing protease CtpA/Prc
MKRLTLIKFLPYFLISGVLFAGCKKDTPEPTPVVVKIPPATTVNTFIWNGLHDYYLWTSLVDGLSNTKYNNVDSLNYFLNKYTDPQDLFQSLLYKYDEVDKWSFMVEDYKTIEDWISGTSKSMGFDFDLRLVSQNSDNIVGIVRYVLPNSPAKNAGMKRGDMFIKVNDQQLTVSNYKDLFINSESYFLGFASVINGTITANGKKSPTMNAIEIQENPILLDTTLVVNNQNVGYLVYNGFNSDFDMQLNDVFKKYKDAGINQLILDLRYNGGGSVQTCIYLASMIYSTDTKKVFAKSQYNAMLQSYFIDKYGESSLTDNFVSAIAATNVTPETPINTLNLQKIYFIVSGNTASASELLINGLKPYVDVKVVGINTVGKYVGSMTIKDWDDFGNVNPDNRYAMQPIVVKYANSKGVSDYVEGLTPDIQGEEKLSNLLPFGDPNEKLLSLVLSDMQGIPPVTAQTLKSAQIGLRKVADSRDFKPFATDMYINPVKTLHQKTGNQ